MCAICGIGLVKGHNFANEGLLQKTITSLLKNCQGGGRSAAGISIMREKEAHVLRRGISMEELIETDKFQDLLAAHGKTSSSGLEGNRLCSVIGHCRIPTKGSPKNNYNNHPVVVKHIIGIHNGAISNDDALFRRYSFSRIAQVDTEIIFQLIAHHAADINKSTTEAIIKASGEMYGSYACAVQNAQTPHYLYLFRACAPTSLRWYPKLKIFIFATSDRYIEDAVKGADFGEYETIRYPGDSGITINLHTGTTTHYSLKFPREKEAYYGI